MKDSGGGEENVKGRRRTKEKCGNAPHHFEKTELETIRPLLAHAEIREDEEARVSVVVL
jgi:hypothetical protein